MVTNKNKKTILKKQKPKRLKFKMRKLEVNKKLQVFCLYKIQKNK